MNAPFDVSGVVLRTPRLLLREWRESDLDDLFAYASDPGVGEMAGWPHHEDMATSKEILDKFVKEKKTFAIYHLADKRVIGSLGVEFLDKTFAALPLCGRELGYVLARPYWGQGLMPEAVEAVVEYLLGALRYDFLTCGHFEWNAQSRRVIEKCGFVPLHISVDYTTVMGTHETACLYIRYNPTREIKRL